VAQLYGPHYQRIWHDALLLPGHSRLRESLAAEFGSYRGASPDEAWDLMERAWADADRIAGAEFPAAPSAASLREYYATQVNGLAAGLYWHSLVPDRWALHSVAALHAAQQLADGHRVFEFGHGAGSTAILFARHGFALTLGDVNDGYRDLTRHRLALRGLTAEFVDLRTSLPQPGAFDVAVSLDVLEHLWDPMGAMRTLWMSLREGGVLILNIAFGRHAHHPEHRLRWRTGVLDRIRSVGFERVPNPSLLVYYKRALSRPRRFLYRAQDLLDALVADACSVAPRLQVLARIARAPGPR
jgi:SAM-dependent methyltransferase